MVTDPQVTVGGGQAGLKVRTSWLAVVLEAQHTPRNRHASATTSARPSEAELLTTSQNGSVDASKCSPAFTRWFRTPCNRHTDHVIALAPPACMPRVVPQDPWLWSKLSL